MPPPGPVRTAPHAARTPPRKAPSRRSPHRRRPIPVRTAPRAAWPTPVSDAAARRAALEAVLAALPAPSVAVSGGVDSMTLAVIAHRARPGDTRMVHAVSAAVPAQASERVRRYARREGWRLSELDAGEMDDARYRANPANRCFFCKTNLYASMRRVCGEGLVSGTNLDDLGDYRPGLAAAAEHGVRHPYVEAGIDKAGVRALARGLGLSDLAELPAAPCLSSRVETGIAIDPRVLPVINEVEQWLARELSPRTVRCRVRRHGIVVELDAGALAGVDARGHAPLAAAIAARFARVGIEHGVSFERYRMGSAFLRPARA